MTLTASYYGIAKRIIGCCFFMLIALASRAQTRGTVEVVQDARIDTLLARRMQPGKAANGSSGSYISTRGYRVQFFMSGSRAAAFNAQNKMQQLRPDLRTYIIYQQPNFKVRAGDFRTRMEAAKLVQDLRPIFPVLFIIAEKINPPLTTTPDK